MRKLILIPCVALLTAAAPADAARPVVASQAAPSAEAQQPVALAGGKATQAVDDKKVCKNLPSSYTRMTERVCLTKEQWKQVDDQSAER